ncbi:MAG: hypothetical protein WDM90_22480 [Ferruginibacter sp.]
MFFIDNKLFLLAETVVSAGLLEGVVITLDANNGNLLNQFKITPNEAEGGGSIWLRNIYRYNDGYIITGNVSIHSLTKYFFLRLDNEFNIIRSYFFENTFTSPNDPNRYDVPLIVEPDGGFYAAMTEPFGHARFYMSPSDSMIWNEHISLSAYGSLYGFCKKNDGLFLFCRTEIPDVTNNISIRSLSITKSTLNGIFPGCMPYPYDISKTPLNLIKTSTAFTVRDTSLFTLENAVALPVVDNIFPIIEKCNGVSTCSNIVVQGPTVVCVSPDSQVSFKGLRNHQCFTSINWEVLGANSKVIKINDSMVNINFLQQGIYKVIGKLGGICSNITDTVNVNVKSVLPPVNIGPPDSFLCKNSTMLLDAGSGFTSYLWQDGSANQTYTVNAQGLYYVEAENGCNQKFRDSILIKPANIPELDLGKDKNGCVNDTLFVNASVGFDTYLWQPSNEIHGQGQSVFVILKKDLQVSVIAQTKEGCIARDTNNVKVFSLPHPNLGAGY